MIGLGGTIAMTSTEAGGVAPTMSAQQLLEAVPRLADLGVEIDALTFRARPGASLTMDDLAELAALIAKECDAGVSGVVITQGTDTIEETAYALDLLHPHPEPIVVTGAMRNPTLAGADGPANLLAAIQVAVSPTARDAGCLVVLADEIHAARRVRKTHATSTATFASPDGGPLGYVIENQAHMVNQLRAGRHVLPAARPATTAPSVVLYTATLGDNGKALQSLTGEIDGLVIAGFGVGHVPENWLPVLTDAAVRIPVVLASRTGAGSTLASTYGFAGSERDLLDRGLIGCGLLHPYKARILLHLALAAGADREQITAAFAVASGLTEAPAWPWPHRRPHYEQERQ